MPYIQPNSTIYLYNNIELDNSYKDTLYFSGIEEQNQYFNVTKPWKYAFVQQMYQRTNKGTLRIEKNAEFLYDCNYLRFVNPRTVDGVTQAKWYYAFITNWEYINENVTEISYEIDIMQTYFFDVIIEPSFVVRQHPVTDELFEHLIAEDLNIGTDYVVASDSEHFPLTPDTVVVFTLKPSAASDLPHGSIINNVPTPLAVKVFHSTDLQSTMNDYWDWLENSSYVGPTQVAENIVAVYLLPYGITASPLSGLIPDGAGDGNAEVGTTHNYVGRTPDVVDFGVGNMPLSFNGYRPHNFKLLTYPYNYVAVSNHLGDVVEYKYELFGTQSAKFGVMGAIIPNPSYICYPLDYRGVAHDYDSGITVSEFPSIPVTINGYQQWLLHNTGKTTAAAVSAIAGLAFGGLSYGMTPIMGTIGKASAMSALTSMGENFTPGVMGQMSIARAGQDLVHNISGTMSNITNIVGQFADATKQANGSKGAPSGSGLLLGANRYEFRQYKMQIRDFEAEKLDTYFDMYGYSMKKVMDVNRNSRPVYNYVKTEGCCIIQNQIGNTNSGATAKVINDMQKIYDNGITFWKPYSGFNIGDYSYNCRNANSLHPQTVTP